MEVLGGGVLWHERALVMDAGGAGQHVMQRRLLCEERERDGSGALERKKINTPSFSSIYIYIYIRIYFLHVF